MSTVGSFMNSNGWIHTVTFSFLILAASPIGAYQLRPLPDVDGRGIAITLEARDYYYPAFGEVLKSAIRTDLNALGFSAPPPPDYAGWHLDVDRRNTVGEARKGIGPRWQYSLDFLQARGDSFKGELLDLRGGCLDVSGTSTTRSAIDKFGLDAWAHCLSRAIVLAVMKRPEIGRALRDRNQIDNLMKVGEPIQQRTTTRVAVAPSAKPIRDGNRVAVLQFLSEASEISASSARYFSEKFRQEALRQLPKCEIVTTENLLVLLQASGKKLEDCEGECAIETGRRLGVDVVVSGAIQRVGTSLKLSASMYDTKDGRLLSTTIASAKNLDELDAASLAAAQQLYLPVAQ